MGKPLLYGVRTFTAGVLLLGSVFLLFLVPASSAIDDESLDYVTLETIPSVKQFVKMAMKSLPEATRDVRDYTSKSKYSLFKISNLEASNARAQEHYTRKRNPPYKDEREWSKNNTFKFQDNIDEKKGNTILEDKLGRESVRVSNRKITRKQPKQYFNNGERVFPPHEQKQLEIDEGVRWKTDVAQFKAKVKLEPARLLYHNDELDAVVFAQGAAEARLKHLEDSIEIYENLVASLKQLEENGSVQSAKKKGKTGKKGKKGKKGGKGGKKGQSSMNAVLDRDISLGLLDQVTQGAFLKFAKDQHAAQTGF